MNKRKIREKLALKGLNLCFNIMNVKLCLLNQEFALNLLIFLFFFNSDIFSPNFTLIAANITHFHCSATNLQSLRSILSRYARSSVATL